MGRQWGARPTRRRPSRLEPLRSTRPWKGYGNKFPKLPVLNSPRPVSGPRWRTSRRMRWPFWTYCRPTLGICQRTSRQRYTTGTRFDVPPEEAAITATNELKGASTKLRSLGHRKIRLQAQIDESKAALKALYVEMQNLMQELKAAEENMETLAKTFRDKVLQAPVQEEDEDFNLSEVLGSIGLSLDEAQLQKVRDAQAQHKLQRRQKAAEQLLAHAGFPPGLGGSPPGIGGQAIAAQLEAIGVTLTPDQKNMVITGQWPGPSQTIDLKAAIEQGCPNMEIEDLELRREELEVQLERKRRKLATQSASPPTSVKDGGKEKGERSRSPKTRS
ncbi:SIAE [Symbiodinium natans]|uniref:SIAE protein n=1 Tax=Symbiodinium natans TaxID=878477 RepID=A0A812LK91_9DINO|nr:SIAE [Symbiodinium natans]